MPKFDKYDLVSDWGVMVAGAGEVFSNWESGFTYK